MKLSGQVKTEPVRIRIIMLVMISAFIFLGAVLWREQVINVSYYKRNIKRQSIRRVRIPGLRGIIFDRNGVILADNKPSYCIAIYPEELRMPGRTINTVIEVDRVINKLSNLLGIEKRITRKIISNHIKKRRPLPLLAWKDIDQKTLAEFSENCESFPGVDIYVEPVRVYPQKKMCAHILGYVGRLDNCQDGDNSYRFFLPEMEGKSGVEKTFNKQLAGKAGGYVIRIDASGFKHDEINIGENKPEAGNDIVLTIDSRIQNLLEKAIMGKIGAGVIIDPTNGDILAMASSPGFDLNRINSEWSLLENNKRKPLFNRAISGVYPPGSIFKPVIAIAALENNVISWKKKLNCQGYFNLGGVTLHCWKKRGHGLLNMRKAIEQSCNVYFFQLGLKTKYNRIYHMAEALGFGRKTGIKIDGESSGLLPDNIWKKKYFNDSWRAGDTCNISIGQGSLLVTPLQMAVFTAAIANGGYIYRPRIVLSDTGRKYNMEVVKLLIKKGELINKMGWSKETMEVIRGGMYDVVEAPGGTGKRVKITGLKIAGKTGTAEYGLNKKKKYTWMIAFVPFDAPRYAMAIIIENGVSGGFTVAPRAKKIIEGIFGIKS